MRLGRLLDGALAGQADLDLGAADDALVLGLAPGLGVDAHLLGGAVGLRHDLAGLLACLLERGAALVVGRLGVGPGRGRPPPASPGSAPGAPPSPC